MYYIIYSSYSLSTKFNSVIIVIIQSFYCRWINYKFQTSQLILLNNYIKNVLTFNKKKNKHKFQNISSK